MTRGILVAAFSFADTSDAAFAEWMASDSPVPHGVGPALPLTRWVDIANPRQAVVVCELADADAIRARSADARANVPVEARQLIWFEGELLPPFAAEGPPSTGGLLLNAMSAAPEHEAEFNEWYDKEHIPALSAVPGTVCARRFRAWTGSPRYLALYHLASPDVQASPEWKAAANTPWTQAMRPRFLDHVRIAAARATPPVPPAA